jgi:hypothetical protein
MKCGPGRKSLGRALSALGCAIGLGLAAASATASDGVIEINQARAAKGGVTVGDTAGFPVTISQAGSYILTGNLDVGDVAKDAIDVTVDGVSIDLNGFVVKGGMNGIVFTAAGTLRLSHGTVTGMAIAGIFAYASPVAANLDCEGLIVTDNSRGIQVLEGRDSVVRNCIVKRNDGFGIGVSGVISDNIASDNADHGISCSFASTITGNRTSGNRVGILAFEGSVVERNTIVSNHETGLGLGSSVARSNCVRNNNTSNSTNAGGILILSGPCLLVDNVVVDNGPVYVIAHDHTAPVGAARSVLSGNTLVGGPLPPSPSVPAGFIETAPNAINGVVTHP